MTMRSPGRRRNAAIGLGIVSLSALVASGAGGRPPDLPGGGWSDDTLVRYFTSDKPRARHIEYLAAFRDGTVTVSREAETGRARTSLLCQGDRARKDLRRLLRRARRLKEEVITQPYPVGGPQGVTFGRRGQHTLRTIPKEYMSVPPMRGKLRRKLFRHMEKVRVRAWRSDRARPCR